MGEERLCEVRGREKNSWLSDSGGGWALGMAFICAVYFTSQVTLNEMKKWNVKTNASLVFFPNVIVLSSASR